LNDIISPIGSNYFKFRIKIEDITLNGSKEEADRFLVSDYFVQNHEMMDIRYVFLMKNLFSSIDITVNDLQKASKFKAEFNSFLIQWSI
jgi:hypothetical protein